jgi:hypothetical protein
VVRFSIELFYGFCEFWNPVRGFNNFYAFPFCKGYVGMLFPTNQEAERFTQKLK